MHEVLYPHRTAVINVINVINEGDTEGQTCAGVQDGSVGHRNRVQNVEQHCSDSCISECLL